MVLTLIVILVPILIVAWALHRFGFAESAIAIDADIYANANNQLSKQSAILDNSDYTSENIRKYWQKPKSAAMTVRRFTGLLVTGAIIVLFTFNNPSFSNIFLGLLLGIPVGIYLNPGNIFNVPYGHYIKWYRIFSLKGQARQIMSFHGEAGWQPHKKLPGWRYVIVAWNNISFFRFTQVPTGKIWYLISRIGETLPPGRKTGRVMPAKFMDQEVEQTYFYENPAAFFAVNGQIGRQRSFLTPGYIGPIDLVAFIVDDGNNLTESASDKGFYEPYLVPDNKFGMVTCLDSAYQIPEGANFARLGGFTDIEALIAKNISQEEVDTKFSEADLARAKQLLKDDQGITRTAIRIDLKDKDEKITKKEDIFRYNYEDERKIAGECLRLLLQGPPPEVADFQNIQKFDELKGSVGPYWQLIRPGRLLNLNRFVFDISLVDPLTVDPGTCEVMILSTGALTRDITQKGFAAGKIVRVGGHGINIKALEPGQYPLPGALVVDSVNPIRRRGRLFDLVTVPTRKIPLFFGGSVGYNIWDNGLEQVRERSRDGIWVAFDFNVIITIPAESAAIIVAEFGTPLEFISEVIAATLYGVTVEYIRSNDVDNIVKQNLPDNKEDEPDEHGNKGVLKILYKSLKEAISNRYGVILHQVRMEHFDAEDYLEVLGNKSKAEAQRQVYEVEEKTQASLERLNTAKAKAEVALVNQRASSYSDISEKLNAIMDKLVARVEKMGKSGIPLTNDHIVTMVRQLMLDDYALVITGPEGIPFSRALGMITGTTGTQAIVSQFSASGDGQQGNMLLAMLMKLAEQLSDKIKQPLNINEIAEKLDSEKIKNK